MKVILSLITVLFLSGCAGHVVTKKDGTVKTPAAVAVLGASALAHESCQPMASYVPVAGSSEACTAGDDACHQMQAMGMVVNGFAKLAYDRSMVEAQKTGCHAQIASETKEYFRSQETKYRQAGSFGRTAIGWVGGFFLGKEVAGAMSGANRPAGDTNIREINMNASSNAGVGAEGIPGGTGGGVNQNLNFNSTQSTADNGGAVNFGEKNNTGDSNNIDDQNDGSGNNPGIFN